MFTTMNFIKTIGFIIATILSAGLFITILIMIIVTILILVTGIIYLKRVKS